MGAPIQAFAFAGRESAEVDPATYDDYYRFTAAAAAVVTVKLEDVPSDLAARLFLYRADGTVSSGLKGGAPTLVTPLPLDAGDHVVSVAFWTGAPPQSIEQGSELPSHFAQPYRLTIGQP